MIVITSPGNLDEQQSQYGAIGRTAERTPERHILPEHWTEIASFSGWRPLESVSKKVRRAALVSGCRDLMKHHNLGEFTTENVKNLITLESQVVNKLTNTILHRHLLSLPLLFDGTLTNTGKSFMLFVLEPVENRYGKASLWRRRSSIRQMVVMTVVFCGDDIEKSLVTLKLLDIGIWHCPLSRTINTCDVFREQPLLSFSGLNNLVTQGWIRLSFNIDPKSSSNDSRRWRLVRYPGFDGLQFDL